MIISQTPYRVSFVGGGTDLPAFYRDEPGAVLSVSLARRIYVTVHSRFQPDLRVAYSGLEVAETPSSSSTPGPKFPASTAPSASLPTARALPCSSTATAR